jgi:hypothetical protein
VIDPDSPHRRPGSPHRRPGSPHRRPDSPARGQARALGLAALLLASACQDPPDAPAERVAPPSASEREDAREFRRRAHAGAFEDALPIALAALVTAEPLTAWRAGHGPAAIPAIELGSRMAVAERIGAAERAIGEIDEGYLEPAQVVILRALRFAIGAHNDELERRPRMRQDPVASLREVEAVLDELRYRLAHDDCDAACEGLAAALAQALPNTRPQLAAAAPAAVRHAQREAVQLAARSRSLAARPLLADYPTLAGGLGQLADALDAHHAWLAELGAALPNATATHVWTAKPALIRPGGVAAIERLPDVLGAQALSRRLAVEERLTLDPQVDIKRVADHVRRWAKLRAELLPSPDAIPRPAAPAPVDPARCEATLARLRAQLGELAVRVPAILPEGPALDCQRYAALLGDQPLDEPALVLALLDDGFIEPARRELRRGELAEIAMVRGQWSEQVHRHLRRIMLLAAGGEPAALERALDEGTRALCLAEAALWVHTDLGLARAARDAIGSKCALVDADPIPLVDRVLGDPRGALAGYGLSLIGDEPAQMVGFDRFFWAPLGLMEILATPTGMHPDQFSISGPGAGSGPDSAADTHLKFEDLTPQRGENWGQ